VLAVVQLEQASHQVARCVLVEIRREIADPKRPLGVQIGRWARHGRYGRAKACQQVRCGALGGGLEIHRSRARHRQERERRDGVNRLSELFEQAGRLNVELGPVTRVQQLVNDVRLELDAVRLDLGRSLEVADGLAM
jgi:hypothetical protein